MLPEPPLPLPPPEIFEDSTQVAQALTTDAPSSAPTNTALVSPVQPDRSLRSSLRKIFKTCANKFGLFRVYYSDSVPRHDPEDPYSVDNTYLLRESSDGIPSEPPPSTNPYHPYPNEFTMRLGDWYWNQGAQKSQDNFKELLDIVGDPAFSSSAISQT